jgi:hypothetical protein
MAASAVYGLYLPVLLGLDSKCGAAEVTALAAAAASNLTHRAALAHMLEKL